MVEFKKIVFIFLAFSLALAVLCAPAWAKDDSVDYSVQMYDLLCLRPAAFLGGIGGTAAFVITLPFTVATGGVDKSFKMLVVKPFWYAFVRKFPDKDLQG